MIPIKRKEVKTIKKTLISISELRAMAEKGQKIIYLQPNMIITPAARDALSDLGIKLEEGPAPPKPDPAELDSCCQPSSPALGSQTSLDPNLIARIVREILASLPVTKPPEAFSKVCDPSGIRLIRGDTVECAPFDTGNPHNKVGLTEILNTRESPNMATGFMTMESSSFDWELKYDELDYVVEGTLDIIVDGKTYRGQAGDVFYIPKNTRITFSTPSNVRFFFVTYPANWAELSNKKA